MKANSTGEASRQLRTYSDRFLMPVRHDLFGLAVPWPPRRCIYETSSDERLGWSSQCMNECSQVLGTDMASNRSNVMMAYMKAVVNLQSVLSCEAFPAPRVRTHKLLEFLVNHLMSLGLAFGSKSRPTYFTSVRPLASLWLRKLTCVRR